MSVAEPGSGGPEVGRRTLVIGGGGFLGSHIVPHLQAAGHEVTIYGPVPAGAPVPTAPRLDGGIEEGERLAGVFAEMRPQLVITLAAHSVGSEGLLRSSEREFRRAVEVNVLGLRNVLEVSRAHGVRRILWASSVVAYGPPRLHVAARVAEDSPLRPTTAYGLTKAMAEQTALFYRDRHGLDVCGLRLPLVFGPGRWYGGVLGELQRVFDRPEEAPLGSKLKLAAGAFDLLYAKDAGRAFAHLADAPCTLPPCYNLAGFTTNFRDLTSEASALLGVEIHIETSETEDLYPLMCQQKVQTEQGFRPAYDLAGALEDYLRNRHRG